MPSNVQHLVNDRSSNQDISYNEQHTFILTDIAMHMCTIPFMHQDFISVQSWNKMINDWFLTTWKFVHVRMLRMFEMIHIKTKCMTHMFFLYMCEMKLYSWNEYMNKIVHVGCRFKLVNFRTVPTIFKKLLSLYINIYLKSTKIILLT